MHGEVFRMLVLHREPPPDRIDGFARKHPLGPDDGLGRDIVQVGPRPPVEERRVVVSEDKARARQVQEDVEARVRVRAVADDVPEEQKIAWVLGAVDREYGLEGPRVSVDVGADENLQLPRTSRARLSSSPFTNLPASAVLNFRAISIASFKITFVGTSGQ